MICKNCGYRNESGDEFCGSCGQFLEWTGVAIEEPEPTQPEPTETKPKPEPTKSAGVAAGRESAQGRPEPRPERPTGGEPPTEAVSTVPITPIAPRQPDVICWNCKSRNKAGRTFCLKCGERLTTGGGSNRGRLLAILLGLGAVILLAIAAAAFFLGGASAPTATPTAPAVTPTPRPSPTASPATATPSPSPAANITPTPTRECSSSAEPIRTVELTRSQSQRRSGNQTAWCIREVVFESRQGAGVLRLTLTNPTAFPSAPDGTVEWLVAAMPEDFDEAGQYRPVIAFPPPFELVPPGTAIRLALECSTSTCNGRVTIAYDRISGR